MISERSCQTKYWKMYSYYSFTVFWSNKWFFFK